MNFKRVSRRTAYMSVVSLIFCLFSPEGSALQSVNFETEGTHSQGGPRIELPKAQHPMRAKIAANAVIVSISADDTYYFGSDRVARADLAERIKGMLNG